MFNLSNSTVPSNDSFLYDEKCVQYGYLSTDLAKNGCSYKRAKYISIVSGSAMSQIGRPFVHK